MICPACSQGIPEGSNYCPLCAADLTKYRRQIVAAQQARYGRESHPPKMRGGAQNPQAYPPPGGMQNSQSYPPLSGMQNSQSYPPLGGMPNAQSYPPLGGMPNAQAHPPSGQGGIFEGITPRGKLFFGIGGLVLLAVLGVLVVNVLGTGGDPTDTQTNIPTSLPQTTFFNPWNTPEPVDEGDPDEGSLDYPGLWVTATPAPTEVPVFRLLKKGESGDDVVRLQERLSLLGYLPQTESVDGQYGQATVNAVRDFQKSVGLPTDGAAGPLTQEELYSMPYVDGSTQDGTGDAPQNGVGAAANQPG
jgi:hypothetical protein